jgi:hypothetical protein
MFTNQLPVLTVGTRAATAEATVNGANQNVDYATSPRPARRTVCT